MGNGTVRFLLLTLAGALTTPAWGGGAADPVAGTRWELATLAGGAPVAGTAVTLNLEPDGVASGTDGCNSYSGTFTAAAGELRFGAPFAATRMACADDVMAQADRFLGTLGEVARYRRDGDALALLDRHGRELLTLRAPANSLSGSSWDVVAYNNGAHAVVSLLGGTAITLEFREDGSLHGAAGCNRYSGPYREDGDTLVLGPFRTTRRACDAPEGVMDQERRFLTALGSAATYRVEGHRLALRTGGGSTAVTAARAADREEHPEKHGERE